MKTMFTNGPCIVRNEGRLHYLGPPCAASEAVERLNAAALADKPPHDADLLLVEGLAVYDGDVDPAVVIL